MNKKYILAHDLGTTGNKATLYDEKGNLVSSYLSTYDTYYPKNSFVEQDAKDWWKAFCTSTKEILKDVDKDNIVCISFSAQMMGCLPVNKVGEPLRRSIIWADTRSKSEEKYIRNAIGEEEFYNITGHRISASYSAAKMLWVKENEREIYDNTFKFLQAKDYLVQKLTGEFVTDYSDACGTNLFDIKAKVWSEKICNSVDLDMDKLPKLHASTDIIGTIKEDVAKALGLSPNTSIVIGGGDGSCAAVGAGAISEGTTYNVLGSSSWIATTTKKPIFDKKMRTFNWVHLDENLYSPCGTMQAAGYSYKWLKDNLCGIEQLEAEQSDKNVYEIINEKIASTEPGANNLLYLPYLLGERSPRWDMDAKGAFLGLSVTHTNSHIYRAVLEGVGYNLKVIKDIFTEEIDIDKIVMIGGGAKGDIWLEILADIFNTPLSIPKYLEEATSMGAAICGGVGVGLFDDFNIINEFNAEVKTVDTNPKNTETYEKLYRIFNNSYEALKPIYRELSN